MKSYNLFEPLLLERIIDMDIDLNFHDIKEIVNLIFDKYKLDNPDNKVELKHKRVLLGGRGGPRTGGPRTKRKRGTMKRGTRKRGPVKTRRY